jgi:hypothetical protein
MYEAPDRYKRMIAARLPDGESAGFARESGLNRLTAEDVQLIARGQLAPFFAITNIAAALLFTAALWGSGSGQPAARLDRVRRPRQLSRDALEPEPGGHLCRPRRTVRCPCR